MSDPGTRCRSCGTPLERTFLDLGHQPLANSFLTEAQVRAGDEPTYPLHVRVCDTCLLVQADAVVTPEAIFSDYAYFSSYSDAWVAHAAAYAAHAAPRLGLTPDDLVVEVASNDGYLLRHFVEQGIPVLGIEPAANVAQHAIAASVPTEVCFFGHEVARRLVQQRGPARLVVANNVLAHVPALNDFVAGLAALLGTDGTLTVEVPHLLRLLEDVEFDTIYHEHLCYFSLLALEPLLARHGLACFDVDRLDTHGGSLRLWIAPVAAGRDEEPGVDTTRRDERAAGLETAEAYAGFAPRVDAVLAQLRAFLDGERAAGRVVAAYGAAAKGNTLLNAGRVSVDDVAFVVDRNPHKQGLYLPGSHVPVLAPDEVRRRRPATLLILPWNLREEITEQMADLRSWGGRFVVPLPRLEILA